MKWIILLAAVGCVTTQDVDRARDSVVACQQLREERLAMTAAGKNVAIPDCSQQRRELRNAERDADEQRRFWGGASNAGKTTGDSILNACATGGC